MSSYRVVIADDQQLLAQSLKTIINYQSDLDVVDVCFDGQQAVDSVKRLQPDIAVIDIRMPVMDGLEALRQILQLVPNTRVLMLTTFNETAVVEDAIASGAHGFLLKDADPEELIAAVRTVARGESVLSTGVTSDVLNSWRQMLTRSSRRVPAEAQQGLSLLTAREAEVFAEVARGLTNNEIAEALHISETTVKTYIGNLLSKLHARDRVALVILARDAGVLFE